MTIGMKIKLLAASLVLMSLAIGAVSLWGLARVGQGVQTLATDAIPGLQYSGEITAAAFKFRGDVYKHIAMPNAEEMAKVEQDLGAVKSVIDQGMRKYEGQITQDQDRANFGHLRTLR